MSDKPFLLLKWRTFKGCRNMTEEQNLILDRYENAGPNSMSAALQKDNETQKEILCELIDTMEDGQIQNDWSGESMTKEQARKYVMELTQ